MKPEQERRKRQKGLSDSVFSALQEMLQNADVLLIVPAFHGLKCPSLAVHLLRASGLKAGFSVQILYANFLLASIIGEENYQRISDAPVGFFTGERLFARKAFDIPALGYRANRSFEPDWVIGPNRDWEIEPDFDCFDCGKPLTLNELRRFEKHTDVYLDDLEKVISEHRYRIIGCTTTFEQTAASIALLKRMKTLNKDTITVLGGANCEGEMARGIASTTLSIDYIFSGESEITFPKFVLSILEGSRPRRQLIHGAPIKDMDALPSPSFAEFYEQRRRFLPSSKMPPSETKIAYETSRGCWWGQKHHCAFCGINEERIPFREKSPGRVISELHDIFAASPTRKLIMSDDIMPHTYFNKLLYDLHREFRGLSILYDQKANLSLPQLLALKRAGVTSIECGIESLSSRLLSLINKGLQARQSLMLLRFGRAVEMDLLWNLLWGIPGDDIKSYQEMLTILPLIRHLQPPSAMLHISIERFSPYYCMPAKFGIRKIKPLAGYYDVLPKGADIERIAYRFTAEYPSGSHDNVDVIYELWQEMSHWQSTWKQKDGPNQDLQLYRRRGAYQLVDTRDLWSKTKEYRLQEEEASALLTSRRYAGHPIDEWALNEKLAVISDGWFVPLTITKPEILLDFIDKRNTDRRTQPFRPNQRSKTIHTA